MKSLVIFLSSLAIISTGHAQNTPWPASGNVGIGTTSPTNTLHVKSGNNGITVESLFTNPTLRFITSAGAGYNTLIGSEVLGSGDVGLVFYTGYPSPVTRMAISNNGNIGIGTISPVAKLHVNSGGIRLEGNTANVWNDASIYTVDDAPGGRTFAFGSRSGTFSISDETVGAMRLLINNAGDVGIGTWTPAANLDVAGCTTRFSNLQPVFRLDFGGGNDLNWKTMANVNLGPGLWVGANFVIEVLDANNNWGCLIDAKPLKYYVRLTRSGGGQDDNDSAEVSGPLNDYVRVVKTNTGVYEIQVRQPSDWKRIILSSQAYSVNSLGAGGGISYTSTLPNGSLGGIIYSPIVGHKDYFNGAYFAGNVGIGTTSPTEKLSVNGKIRAKEIIVETTGWSDYVFAKDYKLASLLDVEQHIAQQGHLPGVPSAKEVSEKGVSIGDMQAILLAKIEELTLHQIAQEKSQIEQRRRLQALEAENAQLKARLK